MDLLAIWQKIHAASAPAIFYVFWGTTATGLLVLVFIRLFI